MFTIIISEKGGAERRESFDKNEINVGRVQGNDLMLPKGNVSKHHARLLYRDGRFIVTDLKSTNGTYVNGRKIAQATIVREGDKIYIGDFVLRLDTGVGTAQASDPEAYRQGAADESQAARSQGRPGVPATALGKGDASPVAHYPLERDPDESEATGTAGPGNVAAATAMAAPMAQGGLQTGPQGQAAPAPSPGPRVPPAPRVPSVQGGPGAMSQGTAPSVGARPGASTQLMGGSSSPTAQRAPVARPAPAPRAAEPAAAAPLLAEPRMPSRMPPRESPQQAGRRLALVTLVDRVADVVDMATVKASPIVDEALAQALDRAIREQAKAMRDEGEAPEGTDIESLARDAHRELIGLGPIGPLLDDEEVTEIHCLRHDQVLATRAGVVTLADASFTTEEALYRVIFRLAQQSGYPWQAGETVIDRRLPRGARMTAVVPPSSGGYVLVVRKRRRVESSLEDFIRGGAMSRQMAVFLEHCVVARANILVAGAGSAGTTGFLGALAGLAPPGERVGILQDDEELTLGQIGAASVLVPDHGVRGEEAVRCAARLRLDRLVVGLLAGNVAAAVVEAVSSGTEGVVACAAAPSLRQGLARLVAQLTMARPGLSVDAARECVGESFDVAVELGRGQDGRARVTRVAELAGADAKGVVARDIFTLTESGGAGEAAFTATGVVPRFVTEFAARGIRIDPNLFKRAAGRA